MTQTITNDNQLIMAYQKGDREAFQTLYYRYNHRAYFYALSLLGHEHQAEEVVQETFLSIISKMSEYRPEGSFKSYLFTSLRNRVIDIKRKESGVREVAPEDSLDLFEGTAQDPQDDQSQMVSQALLNLPLKQREVLILKIYDGMTFQEIGELMGISESTAASRYRYGCEKLRSKLERYIEYGAR